MSVTTRKLIIILLLIVGVQLWLLIGRSHWGTNLQLKLLAVIVVLSALPWVHRPIGQLLERLRQPTPRTRLVITCAIVPIAFTYLLYTANRQQRMLFPHTHDERMYLLQARMLATGRLWLPPHPAGDSFETFYVLVRPVYAAMYFPGTALLYAPGLWLNLPLVALPLLVASAIVALTYRIIAELMDGVAGALAAMLMLALSQLRYLSTMFMSHSAMLLLGLCLTWAWLRWRREKSLAWAAAIGAFAGWAAITRPIDALCFAFPIAIAMLLEIRPLPRKRIVQTCAIAAAAALPFIALQLLFNRAVTGHFFDTPVAYYNRADAPGVAYSFSPPPSGAVPRSALPQKHALYQDMVEPAVKQHAQPLRQRLLHDKFPWIATHVTPNMLLLILLPVGLAGARTVHLPVLAVIPLFIAAYLGFPWLLAHYTIIVAPAIILLILLSIEAIANAWPRWRSFIATASTTSLAMLAITSLPECNRLIRDEWWVHFAVTDFDHNRLPHLVEKPALVLYNFAPGDNPYDEPVYNTETAWPDDADIIRAHDLSDEMNARLYSYYAKHQPARRIYHVDRQALLSDPNYIPRFIGTAKELSDRYNPPRP